jgi:hypothetical protein
MPTTVQDSSRATGFSASAVEEALQALRVGNGKMAQFNHPEYGGTGQ